MLQCCNLEYGWIRSCSKCHTQDCEEGLWSLFKHWHHKKIVTLCKGPRSLVLVSLLGIDGAGGQHHPQPQDPSAAPGERLEHASHFSAALNRGVEAVGTINLHYFKVLGCLFLSKKRKHRRTWKYKQNKVVNSSGWLESVLIAKRHFASK